MHLFLRLVLPSLILSGALFAQTGFETRHARPGGSSLWGLAAGRTGLVAVGEGGTILTSLDGATWTRRNSGVVDWLVGVTYGAGKFVAVGERGRILTSSDGLEWRSVPISGTTQRLNNVIHGGDQFVAVGEAGTILTSPDGVAWTPRASGVTGWLRGLEYAQFRWTSGVAPIRYSTETRYFASGAGGVVLRSRDGIRWESSTPFGTRDLETIAAVNKAPDVAPLLVLSIAQASFATIGDGGVVGHWGFVENWSAHRLGTWLAEYSRTYFVGAPVRFRGLVQGAGALFAVGEQGSIYTAPAASEAWIRLESGTTANLVNGLHVGNTVFVVGENETILQSTPLPGSKLVNIATRGLVGRGEDALIAGFNVAGVASRRVLIRAVGPTLAALGVSGALMQPLLEVFRGQAVRHSARGGWSARADADEIRGAAVLSGAFPLTEGSDDAALVVTLEPGSWTVKISGANDTTGVALVEVYDLP